MSYVYTAKQVAEAFDITRSYMNQFVPALAQFRVLSAGGVDEIISRFIEAFETSDAAYVLEEWQMFNAWMNGAYGVPFQGRQDPTDKAFTRGYKLHKLPADFLTDWPSPYIFVTQQIDQDHFPHLPQVPQIRRRIPLTNPPRPTAYRTIRVHDSTFHSKNG